MARDNYEEALADADGRVLMADAGDYVKVLKGLMAVDTAAARPATADRMVDVSVRLAEELAKRGDAEGATKALADCAGGVQGLRGDAGGADRLGRGRGRSKGAQDRARDRVKYLETLQANPADAKANWGLAVILLREGKAEEAAKHLAACDGEAIQKLAALLKSPKATSLDKGEAYRKAAGGLPSEEKAVFLGSARAAYESALADEKLTVADRGRVGLLVKELPEILGSRGGRRKVINVLAFPAVVEKLVASDQGGGLVVTDTMPADGKLA